MFSSSRQDVGLWCVSGVHEVGGGEPPISRQWKKSNARSATNARLEGQGYGQRWIMTKNLRSDVEDWKVASPASLG